MLISAAALSVELYHCWPLASVLGYFLFCGGHSDLFNGLLLAEALSRFCYSVDD